MTELERELAEALRERLYGRRLNGSEHAVQDAGGQAGEWREEALKLGLYHGPECPGGLCKCGIGVLIKRLYALEQRQDAGRDGTHSDTVLGVLYYLLDLKPETGDEIVEVVKKLMNQKYEIADLQEQVRLLTAKAGLAQENITQAGTVEEASEFGPLARVGV